MFKHDNTYDRLERVYLVDEIYAMVRKSGLRPTVQRVGLATLLFRDIARHVTADSLYTEACAQGLNLTLATVYNTLNQFTEAGLVRRISVCGEPVYFDTNVREHHHFYIEDEKRLVDTSDEADHLRHGVPEAPSGYMIAGVDLVVRLKKEKRACIDCSMCGKCIRS